MLSALEEQVIAAIQADMPVCQRPYAAMAAQLAIPEEELLRMLRELVRRGVIRRFGATLRHQKSGYAANAMAAWQVAEERIEAVGKLMASFRAVSHCYRRNPSPAWPYNLYTMIHGRDEEACRRTAAKMAAKADVQDYALLFSRRELKKTSMKYFDLNGQAKACSNPQT
jgi:DNA-binding Lrp family transcriptional regulator